MNRTQLTKGGYTTLTTMQGHLQLVMQGSTLLRHAITPRMHTTHTLGHTVYYSKTAHMTSPTQNHNCKSCTLLFFQPGPPCSSHNSPHMMGTVMWCSVGWNEGAKNCSTVQCVCRRRTVLWRSPLSSLYLTV